MDRMDDAKTISLRLRRGLKRHRIVQGKHQRWDSEGREKGNVSNVANTIQQSSTNY